MEVRSHEETTNEECSEAGENIAEARVMTTSCFNSQQVL